MLQFEPEDVEAREETHFDRWSESGDENTPQFDWDGPESIAITCSLLTEWSKSLKVTEIHPDAIKGGNASFVKWYLRLGQHREGYPNALHVATLILADAGYDVYASDTRIEIY